MLRAGGKSNRIEKRIALPNNVLQIPRVRWILKPNDEFSRCQELESSVNNRIHWIPGFSDYTADSPDWDPLKSKRNISNPNPTKTLGFRLNPRISESVGALSATIHIPLISGCSFHNTSLPSLLSTAVLGDHILPELHTEAVRVWAHQERDVDCYKRVLSQTSLGFSGFSFTCNGPGFAALTGCPLYLSS
jgi:hypothetical protein